MVRRIRRTSVRCPGWLAFLVLEQADVELQPGHRESHTARIEELPGAGRSPCPKSADRRDATCGGNFRQRFEGVLTEFAPQGMDE